MFFRNHGINPKTFVTGNGINNRFKGFTFKAFGDKDLSNFFALTFWNYINVMFFLTPYFLKQFFIGLGGLEITDCHTEAISHKV